MTYDTSAQKAGATRKPCRRGEYIVISLGPGYSRTNTIVIKDATSARDALHGRIALMDDAPGVGRRDGQWLVTNGRHSFLYEAHRDGTIKQLAGMDPAREAEWFDD